MTDIQALKDKVLLLGTCNERSDVGIRRVPVERIVTTTAGFSLKNLQKPHNSFFFFFWKEIFKIKAGLDFMTSVWLQAHESTCSRYYLR